MSDALRLYVYQNGERVGMVDSANSLQWAPAFADVGEIKLVCGATATNRAMLVQGAVLYNPDTPGLAALIVATELDSDARKLTVRGKFTLQRFAQRIAKGQDHRDRCSRRAAGPVPCQPARAGSGLAGCR